jgi:HEPN domain-containing protein
MSDPDPADSWQIVAEWLRIAISDHRAARLCLTDDPPLLEVAAYHCQQAAEKILKGFLVQSNTDFRKTHDLDELGDAVIDQFPDIAALVRPAQRWTSWGVDHRYPGETGPVPEPSAGELSAALDLIAALADALRALEPPA